MYACTGTGRCWNGGLLSLYAFKMVADTTREVITVISNTGKYPPTYGDLFPYVIERGGTSPGGVEMQSSGPWLVTNIDTPAGDEATKERSKAVPLS